jgi:hypothetical protein
MRAARRGGGYLLPAGLGRASMAHDRAIMSFDQERRHAVEYDQNPNRKASVPKECVDHECDSFLKELMRLCCLTTARSSRIAELRGKKPAGREPAGLFLFRLKVLGNLG